MTKDAKQDSPDRQEDEKEFGWLAQGRVFAIVIFAVLFIGLGPAVAYKLRKHVWPDSAGLFGDSFGFVNAMVSGCAFAAVIITLRMQRKELKLQRQELEDTREELRRSADAQTITEKRLATTAVLTALESLRSSAANTMQQYTEDSIFRGEAAVLLNRIERRIAQELSGFQSALSRDEADGWQGISETLLQFSLEARTIVVDRHGTDAYAFVERFRNCVEELILLTTDLGEAGFFNGMLEHVSGVESNWQRLRKGHHNQFGSTFDGMRMTLRTLVCDAAARAKASNIQAGLSSQGEQ